MVGPAPARPATPADGCAWITGASSGIGRALALNLAAAGWTVAVSARRADALDEVVRAAGEGPGRIVAYPLDVTDGAAVAATLERIEAEVAPVARAVLNAGMHKPTPAADFRAEAVEAIVTLNVLAVARGLDALLPRMRERGRGQIAIVASVAGYRGLPTAAGYGASKAAAINMAEALRPELEAEGILMQVVNPGFIETPMTAENRFPMPMLMSVRDAAAALTRGLDSRRFEIVFPRLFCWFVKLYRCLPYALALALARRMVAKAHP